MKLPDGYEVEIIQDNLDQWDMLDAVSQIMDGQVQYLPKLARLLLGDQGVKDLTNHLRDENGRLSSVQMSDTLMAIFQMARAENAAGKEEQDLKKS